MQYAIKTTNAVWKTISQAKGLSPNNVKLDKALNISKNNISSIDVTKVKDINNNITKEISLIHLKNNKIGTFIKELKGKKCISKTISYIENLKNSGQVKIQKKITDKLNHSEIREQTFLSKSYINYYSKLSTSFVNNRKDIMQNQKYGLYSLYSEPKEYNINIKMSKDGKINSYKEIFKNVDLKVQNRLKDNHYAALVGCNNHDTAYIEHFFAEKNHNVADMKSHFYVSNNLGKVFGYRKIEGYVSNAKDVNIRVDSNIPRTDLIDTVNHEYRHVYQNKLMDAYDNLTKRKKMSQEEIDFAKKCIMAEKQYSTRKNVGEYYKNFLEADARKAGAEAASKYRETFYDLLREFQLDISLLDSH